MQSRQEGTAAWLGPVSSGSSQRTRSPASMSLAATM